VAEEASVQGKSEGMMERTTYIVVSEANEGERIDVFLAKYLKRISRSRIQEFIRNKQVTLDGRRVLPSTRVRSGSTVRIEGFRERPFAVAPEPVPFSVIYYDEHIIVVDKPSGLIVHPARVHLAGTLVNGLLYRFGRLPESVVPGRPGIVHRLDRDTSGVMVVARTKEAYEDLKRQFKERTVAKVYLAITHGVPRFTADTIDLPLDSSCETYNRVVIAEGGKEAVTAYAVVRECGKYALLRVFPKTGRTHQIRVHLKHIGHPVLCDTLYGYEGSIRMSHLAGTCPGGKDDPVVLSRLALHAERLTFVHPATGAEVTFSSPMPSEFISFLEAAEGG